MGKSLELVNYEGAVIRIDKEADIKKRQLAKEYALMHSNVKIGDVVTDHIGTIRVRVIGIYYTKIPGCIYRGVCLTKAGKPFKSGEERDLYQVNVK